MGPLFINAHGPVIAALLGMLCAWGYTVGTSGVVPHGKGAQQIFRHFQSQRQLKGLQGLRQWLLLELVEGLAHSFSL